MSYSDIRGAAVMSGVSGSFEEGAEYSQVVFLSVLLRLSHPMFFQRDFPTGFFRPCFSIKLIGCSVQDV